ncbi:MAG TPA: phytanoyl-CoA dioxygenase family protein [Acidimicrobiales bacterium]|nr:phytanoyl-CoA dioxygenase family protein [Acidimicrobiales bacterium]
MALAPPFSAAVAPEVLGAMATDLEPTGGLTFYVDGDAVTYSADGTSVRVDEGGDHGATAVRLSRQAWDDLVAQVRTFIGLYLANELTFERGRFEQLADWDPLLRYLHAGLPPYDPAQVDFEGRDPAATFDADADDADLADQLRVMGYLHVKGVFSAEEMEAADREIDRLAALARPGDNRSWWVTTEDGSKALCRLVYTTLRSPVLAALETDPRVRRLGTLLDRRLELAADRMEGTPVLIKVPGGTAGLSNIPWHQDCGIGGHAFLCPATSVGIQITGSDATTGNLQVVPGSHGKVLHYRWQDRLADVPVVHIDTAPGDVTVHMQDVMHASPKPAGSGHRRTMYVTYYPPALWDHIGAGEAFNDLVRSRTEQVARLQGPS